jgi:hypothetical protein
VGLGEAAQHERREEKAGWSGVSGAYSELLRRKEQRIQRRPGSVVQGNPELRKREKYSKRGRVVYR